MSAFNKQNIAQRLSHATTTATSADPTGCAGLDLHTAYSIADATRALAITRGERVVGYKIGLTSRPARQAFDAVEPAFGYLLDSSQIPAGGTVNTGGLSDPAVEVEIAFILGATLENPDTTAQEVVAATDSVAPALEIVGSRWNGGAADLPMLVADNTNAAAVVLGERTSPPNDLAAVTSTLAVGGQSIPGRADAVLGNPCEAVAWLARRLTLAGTPLEVGQIVLSGTLSAPTPLRDIRHASAELTDIGSVSAHFSR